MANCGLFKWLLFQCTHDNDVINSGNKVGPVGCQISGGHEKHYGSMVKSPAIKT